MLSGFEKKLVESVKFTCHKHAVLTKSVDKGIGWGCVDTIKQGEVILAVPPQTWLPYSADYAAYEAGRASPNLVRSIQHVTQQLKNNNKVHSDLYDRMESSIYLAAKLMLDKNDKIPYVDFLASQSISSPLPLSCSSDMLHALNPKYSTFNNVVARLKLYQIYINIFGESNKESFLWSMSQILSRGLSSSVTNVNVNTTELNNSHPFTMVPILDFANHSHEPNAYYEYIDGNKPIDMLNNMAQYKDNFVLMAKNDIKPDTEICISYGENRCNSSFFTLYGFTSPDNSILSANNTFQCPVLLTKGVVYNKPTVDTDNDDVRNELAEINILIDEWKNTLISNNNKDQQAMSVAFEMNLDNMKYLNKLPVSDVPNVFSEILHMGRVSVLDATHLIDYFILKMKKQTYTTSISESASANKTEAELHLDLDLELNSEMVSKLLDEIHRLEYVNINTNTSNTNNHISLGNELDAVRHILTHLESYCRPYKPYNDASVSVSLSANSTGTPARKENDSTLQQLTDMQVNIFKHHCDYLNTKELEYWVAIKVNMERYLKHLGACS